MTDDYRVAHRAPSDDGYSAPITAVREMFGPDFIEHPNLYGTADEQTMRQIAAALDGADTVRIYRAVPSGSPAINDGDWVTLSRAYAHDHGWHEDEAQVMPVVAADVPVATVYTDGNDPSEWGYTGAPLTGLTPMYEGDPEVTGPPDTSRAQEALRIASQSFPSRPGSGLSTPPSASPAPPGSPMMRAQDTTLGY